MEPFQADVERLLGPVFKKFGMPCTYVRDGTPHEITAVPGKTHPLDNAVSGMGSIGSIARMFIVRRDEIPFPPRPGDIIHHGESKYRVLNENGVGCWRPSDATGIAIRVFTKDVSHGLPTD